MQYVPIQVIQTGDGSGSLRRTDLNETYHSVHGAVAESEHVFIKEGLLHKILAIKDRIRILEVGFGTGLNALLTLREAIDKNLKISYSAIEPYLLQEEVINTLQYPRQINRNELAPLYAKMHAEALQEEIELHENFRFRLFETEFLNFRSDQKFDLIYYDAFAPGKQPDMWTEPVMRHLKHLIAEEGVLVTYCAQSNFRKILQSLGMEPERVPGPPGKREMTRAKTAR